MHAVPLPPIRPDAHARFLEYVDQRGPDDCWPWIGGRVHGYGTFRLGKRKVRAHRVAWVLAGNPEPDGSLHLDHACHDPEVCRGGGCPHRACVNPAHLRVATPAQNVANSNARSRQLAERESCEAGHPFDAANTRVDPRTGVRICRACQAATMRSRKVLVGRRPDFDTHCPHGHEWTEANTRIARTGARVCRRCATKGERERRAAATRR